MEGYKSKIGKRQMLQYMGGMYENSLVVYREYLGNACDAVEEALRQNIILNRKHANIAVTIDTFNKRIIIHDVGIGIAKADIGPCLVSVASSNKYKKDLVGRFGIGRLNGAKYCDRIVYETSVKGEDIKSTLVWDVAEARRLCEDDAEDLDTTEIIDKVTHRLPEQPEDVDTHYCKVTLENVNDPHLMDEDAVRQYISEIVSVDYSLEFKDNALSPSLDLPMNAGYEERFNNLWVYEVTVNNHPVEKTYRSEFNDKHLGVIQCFTLNDDKTQEELAWGWFSLNRTAEQLNDLPFSFIRARHHNFQIGDSSFLTKYHKNTTAANYIIGELHITHPNITPTGSRDGFEAGADLRRLETALRKKLLKIYKQYDNASHFRSNVIGVVAKLNTEIAGIKLSLKEESDPDEKAKLKDKIKKALTDRKNALGLSSKYQTYFEDNGLWAIVEDIVDAVNESTIEQYNNKAKVQKADAQIPELKLEEFKPNAPKPASPNTPNSQSNEDTDPKQQDNPSGENIFGSNTTPGGLPTTPTEPPVPNEMDDYKSLSTVERALVRKFLSVINSMSDLPDKQKTKLKTRLRKKIIK